MKKRTQKRRPMLAEYCRRLRSYKRVSANFMARCRLGLEPQLIRAGYFEYDRFHNRTARNKNYRAFGWRLRSIDDEA
jgi:hypothetical protein